ncbi:DNA-binding protein [Zhengella mangrovi]|uniref:DNA-binding protein n=1 Tax=Zhengella mangrovi TaxID=1982044 RepID=A0A2G1QU65_9HYPH|nr:RNA-binding protein [Zhengella mangrovi]PHP69042.1 DNA-binding protein [Zhengella mangrovi]
MAERTCIVTRQAGEPDRLIRFVAGPDLSVVPDLKRNLPGRGCWVTATRARVDQAARKNLFRRALKAEVSVDPELGALVDRLLVKSALGAILMARKAGQFVTGSAKCDAAVRSGQAVAVLHAFEAAPDGVRKLDQARRAVEYMDGPVIPAFKLFPEAELGLAIGGTNVIHAAVLDGQAGRAAVKRIVALHEYREGPGTETDAAKAAKDDR